MIEAKSLTMYYGATMAVENVSFRVEPGEILGLLGPNGAGKTTIMNMLTTQIIPTSGTVVVNGFDVLEEPLRVRASTGYLPETVPVYVDMEVAEYLRFVGKARGLGKGRLEERLEWVVEMCRIRPVLRRLIAHLSKGYRQRVALAQALIHDPQVLVLDEPTSGLDPLQIIEIRRLIQELSGSKTIIVSTHILQEVEAVSHRIVILNEGRIIADGTRTELQSAVMPLPTRVISLEGDPLEIERVLKEIPNVRRVEPMVRTSETGPAAFRITMEPGGEVWKHLARSILDHRWLIRDSWMETPTLEDAFIHLTRSSSGGNR